jgi:hypothetical protein
MRKTRSSGAAHAHHHAVQFYGAESSLFATVAEFLSEGLIAGQPAVVIGTAPHVQGICDQLRSRLIDVDEARRVGDLVILDADEMLSLFMVNGEPDAHLFNRNIGGLITQTLGGRRGTVLRAYGEMVDILWKQGQTDAAIKLEILWNTLADTHRFALLCGYAMGSFYKQPKQFADVIDQHTHVISVGANVVPFGRKRAAGR